MARVMAIDYGDARTGVAFSDLTGTLAGEALTITEHSPKVLASKLAELAQSRDADTVALGWPLNEDGSAGPRTEVTKKLANRLKGFGLRVELIDERYTSLEAQEILHNSGVKSRKSKGKLDAVAATLILESYLRQ